MLSTLMATRLSARQSSDLTTMNCIEFELRDSQAVHYPKADLEMPTLHCMYL
jgi:hypothetical protein